MGSGRRFWQWLGIFLGEWHPVIFSPLLFILTVLELCSSCVMCPWRRAFSVLHLSHKYRLPFRAAESWLLPCCVSLIGTYGKAAGT